MIRNLFLFAGFPVSFRDIWLEVAVVTVGVLSLGLLTWLVFRKPYSKEKTLAYVALLLVIGVMIAGAAFSIYAMTSGRVFDWRW